MKAERYILKKAVCNYSIVRRITQSLCVAFLCCAAVADEYLPVQTFYISIPEDDLLRSLQTIEGGRNNEYTPSDPVQSYLSIAVFANDTRIYYDQWENGFDSSIENPANLYNAVSNPGGTQIWGDGDPSNGFAPGFPGDTLSAGDVVLLVNPVTTTTRAEVIDFDGGDKFASSKPVAVTRAVWASGSATLFAGANEVYDTAFWGTEFQSPVGVDISDWEDYQMFEYTGFSIMAGSGGATVQVDADADGVFETTRSLDEGEGWLIDGGVSVGGRVISDNPVQVDLITADIYDYFESRFVRLLPTAYWSSSQTTPISTPAQVDGSPSGSTVWLYNPGQEAMSLLYITRAQNNLVTNTIVVPGGASGGYLKQNLDSVDCGARFINTEGLPFYALTAVDSTGTDLSDNINDVGDNRTWDWGFLMVPETSLSPQVLVGLGIGRDPTSSTNPYENASPVWVTPVGNGDSEVMVYVDYDSDPDTGALIDPEGNRYDAVYEAKELEQLKIYNPSGDQTGMLVYVLDPDVKLAAAWGEDPDLATPGSPGLDLGTGIPPFPLFVARKRSSLLVDADNDGFVSPGDTLRYSIMIENTGRQPVAGLDVMDELPSGLNYLTNTTFFVNAVSVTNRIQDDSVPSSQTVFPLDEGGIVLPEPYLPVRGIWEVQYAVTVDSYENLPSGTVNLQNTATVGGSGITTTNTVITPICGRVGNYVWWDLDEDGLQASGEPGLNGVTVSLLYSDGSPVLDDNDIPMTTVTSNDAQGAEGYYLFTGVQADSYMLSFAPPAGYQLTTADSDSFGIEGELNSDADIQTGYTEIFTLGGGQTFIDVDAGFIADPGFISGAVRFDVDGDGIIDPEDTQGIAGVTVQLLDANSNIVAVTTTSLTGGYSFSDVRPGNYTVVQLLPPAYVNTYDVAGENDLQIPLVLSAGESSVGNDFYDTRNNSLIQQNKVLYLSDPDQSLDRIDPVAVNDSTTSIAELEAAQVIPDPVMLDNTSSATGGGSSSLRISHATGTGDNRLMVVGIAFEDDISDGAIINSVTYGSQSLTRLIRAGNSEAEGEIWYLTAPASGTADVVVNMSNMESEDTVVVGVSTYTGVDQSTPFGTPVSATGNSASSSVSVSSSSDDLVFAMISVDDGRTATAGSGQSEIWNTRTESGADGIRGAATTQAGGISSSTSSWTLGYSDLWVALSVPIRQVSSTGGDYQMITMVGDAASSTTSQTASSHSFSYNSGNTGENRCLMVGISYYNYDWETVSSITYGGEPLTLVGTAQVSSGWRPSGCVYIYRLVDPPTGANALNVTWSSSLNNSAVIGAVTYAGVDQQNPTGEFSSLSGTSSTPSVSVTSDEGQLVFGVVDGRATGTYYIYGSGSALWNNVAYGGYTVGSAQFADGAASGVTLSWWGSDSDWVAGGVSLHPAVDIVHPVTSFTQSPAFVLPFSMTAGSVIAITNYINVTDGVMPANPEISAFLSVNGQTFLTFSDPVFSNGALVWSGELPADVNIAAGQALSLTVSNAQSNVGFEIRYDSAEYPSKIILPTTSIIEIPSLAICDAPYPDGNPVESSRLADEVYVRVTVTDPFGSYDINGVSLRLDGSGSLGDLDVMLDDTAVVSSNEWSKIYEYAWSAASVTGVYSVIATAFEGTEGVTASNSVVHTLYNACIGDRVFADYNANGVWDAGEGLAGVDVTLSGDIDGDGDIDTRMVTTGADGYYLFDDLYASEAGVVYTVSVDVGDIPAGLTLNTVDPDGGNDSFSIVSLTVADPVDLDQDFGYRSPEIYNISGFVRDDYDMDGAFSDPDLPVGGVLINLYSDPDGDGDPSDGAVLASTNTLADGSYIFTEVIAGNYVVVENDPVYSVSTADTFDANDNMIPVSIVDQDSIENNYLDAVDPSGYLYDVTDGRIVPGGSVSVLGDGAVVLMDGSSGQYSFVSTNTTETSFTLVVTPPPGYIIDPTRPAETGAFDPTGGSDPTVLGSYEDQINPGYLVSYSAESNTYYYTFTLAPGDSPVINNNFPLVKTVTIGDRVWEDYDGNGVQDAGENGVSNVVVKLMDASGIEIASSTTDGNGNYLFPDLPPAEYSVAFTPPEKYVFTVQDAAAATDADDSDVSQSNGLTALQNYLPGETNLTLDAGVYIPARIYGYLFEDENNDQIRNSGDTTITNALVSLIVNGRTVDTTYTDENGYYEFDDVPAGVVTVQVVQSDADLVDVPLSDSPMRNRATESAADTAVIEYNVVSGYGVLSSLPGEPLNFGYDENPLSTQIDLKAYSTSDGKVMLDISTVNENGNNDIEIYAFLKGEWVLVAKVPSAQIVGFGSNTYKVEATGLTAGLSYRFKIVDESGHIFEMKKPIKVARARLRALKAKLDPETFTMTFNTEPYVWYMLNMRHSFAENAKWQKEYVQIVHPAFPGGVSPYVLEFQGAPDGTTTIRVPRNRNKAFFKLVRVEAQNSDMP